MTKKFKNKRASLLIEVLLSIVILSVSITVIIQSMASSARAMDFSADYAAAAALLENKMQEYIIAGSAPSGGEEGTFEQFNEKYRYSVRVSESEDPNSNLNIVELTVRWDAGNKENSVSLQSYLMKEE